MTFHSSFVYWDFSISYAAYGQFTRKGSMGLAIERANSGRLL